MSFSFLEYRFKEPPGIGFFADGDVLGSSGDDYSSAAVASLRSEVDDIVRNLYHVEVMLNENHGVAAVHELLKHLYELMDVGGVEPCGGLVKNIDGFPGGALRKLGGELNTLGFAAGKGCRRLSEGDVDEAHVL